jgi:hypothetical protein
MLLLRASETRVAFRLTLSVLPALGFLLIVPIGGADMAVVISMPHSYSGWVACGIGLTLWTRVQVITGALAGFSPRPTSAAANSPANSPAGGWIITRNLRKKLTLSAMSRADLRFLPELRENPSGPGTPAAHLPKRRSGANITEWQGQEDQRCCRARKTS